MSDKIIKSLYSSSGSIALALLMVAQANPAYAQADPSPPANSSAAAADEEIIVTANKREESINKVGLTIKALGAAQLEQQKVTSLQDLAVAVPGLVYTQTDTNTPVYTLRGIGFYDTTMAAYPSVSVYLDQAPLSFPTLTTQTLFDIERIEVLKGPQGTLFGQNSTGGAINYIAAKPTDEMSAGIAIDYARFNTFTADAYVSGPLSDNLLGRIAVHATSGDGWQKSITRPDDRNGAPETFAARFLLDWRPTDRLRIQTNLNGWRDRSEPPAAQFVQFIPNWPIDPTTPLGSGFVPFVPNAVNKPRLADWTPKFAPEANNRLLQASVRADYDVTDAITLTSLTSYVDYKQRQRPEGDGLPQERIDITDNNGYIHSFSTELRLSDNNNPVFRWTVGANYGHDVVDEYTLTQFHDSTSNFTFQFANLPFPSNSFTNHQVMSNYAAFAAGEYTIGQITLKGGVRYTQADRKTANCNQGATAPGDPNNILSFFNLTLAAFGVPPAPAGSCTIFAIGANGFPSGLHEFRGKQNENNLSWRAGVDWKPSENTLLYFLVAKGYKAGSFPHISGSLDRAFTPVKQESVLNIEGGIKAQLFDRKLSVNLSAFYNDYRNKQIKSKLRDPLFGSLDALVNVPKSEIKGVELEVTARPVTGLTLGGAVTYLDTELTDASDLFSSMGTFGDFSGNPVPRAPKWNVSGNFNYTVPVSSSASAFFGGQITYRSSQEASIGAEPNLHVPSATLIDAQAGVDFNDGKYRVMIWGKNITNEFYLTNINKYTDGIQRFIGKPATYGVTLAMKY